MVVGQGKITRGSATAAEPICDQIFELLKVVDIGNVLTSGISALTKRQADQLKAAMARTMMDVFKAAYQHEILLRCSHVTKSPPRLSAQELLRCSHVTENSRR